VGSGHEVEEGSVGVVVVPTVVVVVKKVVDSVVVVAVAFVMVIVAASERTAEAPVHTFADEEASVEDTEAVAEDSHGEGLVVVESVVVVAVGQWSLEAHYWMSASSLVVLC